MRTRGFGPSSILAVSALLALTLTGCGPGQPEAPATPPAPPTTDQPTPEPETRYSVESLTKDDEPVEITGWTHVDLPDTLVGGEIRPSRVCNNPGFEITEVTGGTWTTVKTGIESAEGCGPEAQAVKDAAVGALDGELTVDQTGDGIEITNPPYRLVLEPTQ
jgi:hypothetical protein